MQQMLQGKQKMKLSLYLGDGSTSSIHIDCYHIENHGNIITFYSKQSKNIVFKLNFETKELWSKNDKYPELVSRNR